MKILTIAIPNRHFFQWVNQLEGSGHEVYWFDIKDDRVISHRIKWVNQIKGWRLKWDYPLRSRIKSNFPKLYQIIQKWNENSCAISFEKSLKKINPDMIHVFEMHLSGLPILSVLLNSKVPVIYSSWGSDLYNFKELGRKNKEVQTFLQRSDFLLTDCKRDKEIALDLGFKNKFLGVFPGNGGIMINDKDVSPAASRDIIMIKGYDDGVGQALVILKALELLNSTLLETHTYFIYSADTAVEEYIQNSSVLSVLNFTIFSRRQQVSNEELVKIMGTAALHIANSLSDGMPNALLEAMGMGAFPIQSNPGKVTEEIITHGVNGFLIENPHGVEDIKLLIEKALLNADLRFKAQEFNSNFIDLNYNRHKLRLSIQKMYQDINPVHK
jgi:glycosyltransferase involved in cell wall biosynthesis